MDENFAKLYEEFMSYANSDDEAGARQFLIDNLTKFPEDVQEKITFAFFEEALKQDTAGMQEVAEMQKEGVAALKEIDTAKKIIEDKIKERDLKAKITGEN